MNSTACDFNLSVETNKTCIMKVLRNHL